MLREVADPCDQGTDSRALPPKTRAIRLRSGYNRPSRLRSGAQCRFGTPRKKKRPRSGGRSCRRRALGPRASLAVTTLEPLHPTTRVDKLLLAGEEGVALVAQLGVQLGLRRTRREGIAARAAHVGFDVIGVNVSLHGAFQCSGERASDSRALGDLRQELVVGLGGADLVDEQLEARGPAAVGRQGVEDPAQLPHLLELAPLEG